MTSPDSAQPLAPASPSSPSVFVDPGRRSMPPTVRGALFLVSISVLIGGVFGAIWNAVVALPTYVVDQNSGASTTERGLTQYFSTDAWFVLFGVVGGLLIGLLSWRWFGRRGWVCVPIALVAALVAALMCWGMGSAFGPHDFNQRIADARPGDRVEIDFELHSWTALVVWPFLALVPVLIGSSFAPEPKQLPLPASPTSGDQ